MSLDRKPNVFFESGFPLHRYSVQWKIRYFSAYLEDAFKGLGRVAALAELESPEFSTNSGQKLKLKVSKPSYGETEYSFTLVSKECVKNIQTELSLIIGGQKQGAQRKTIRQLSTNSDIIL
jgi:hypothetical protein